MVVVIINVLYTNTHVEGYLSDIGSTLNQMERSELWRYRAKESYRGLVTGCGAWEGWFCGDNRYDFGLWNYGVLKDAIMRGCGYRIQATCLYVYRYYGYRYLYVDNLLRR